MGDILLGTCSWNYDSWEGLVYSEKKRTAAEYLIEYSQHFNTAEIDSWFYKIPSSMEARVYDNNTPKDFTFTAKVWQKISLTHTRSFGQGAGGDVNPDFLSLEAFKRFCDAAEPLRHKISVFMFEFEYLNKDKMPSLGQFMDQFSNFRAKIDPTIPIGIETRNKNYLTEDYFRFLRDQNIIHVFSEKQYMPHFYQVFQEFREYIGDTSVLRLLGNDRKEIEKKTHNNWNQIVDEKPHSEDIIKFSIDSKYEHGRVIVNVNNHYEGSAPLTIRRIREHLKGTGINV